MQLQETPLLLRDVGMVMPTRMANACQTAESASMARPPMQRVGRSLIQSATPATLTVTNVLEEAQTSAFHARQASISSATLPQTPGAT